MSVIEKRRHVRYEVAVAAEVYTGGDIKPASTRNLSRGGVCLELGEPLNEGSDVGVSLVLTLEGIETADIGPLNVAAKVCWVTERDGGGYLAGANFKGLDPGQEDQLASFLAALEPSK